MAMLIHGFFRESSIPVDVKRIRSNGWVYGVGGRPHEHDFTETVVFMGGTGDHIVNDRTFQVTRGDAFVIEQGEQHCISRARDLEYLEVHFQRSLLKVPYELLEQIPGFAVLFLPVSHSPSDAPYRRFLRLDEEQLSQLELIFLKMQKEFAQQPVGYEAALHGALVEYLVHLSRCYPRTATKEATTSALAQIAPIIDAVHDHTTHAWTLEEMAGIGAMSTSKLLVVFREATGMTPIEYLIRQRIRDSMFELRNTRDSVTEIAYRVGFSDSNYFARQFRKVMEMSPTEYRRAGHG